MSKIFSNFSKEMNKSEALPFAFRLLKNSFRYSLHRHFNHPRVLPKIIRFNITNLCDSRCKTCFIWDYYRTHPEKLKEEATFNELKQFIEKNSYIEDIMITGGQVTLRKDIVSMWLYLDKKGYRTGGATNSVNLKQIKTVNKETLEKLSGKNTHSIYVSIDGLEKSHDKIRGIKGEFKNAVKLLRWALDKQKEFDFLYVGISHNITPVNYKQLPDFLEYFINLGLKPSQISFRATSSLKAYQNTKSKEIALNIKSKNKIKDLIEVLKEVKNKYKEYDDYFIKGIINYIQNPRRLVIPCSAAFFIGFIDPYWNIYPCYNMDTRIGNLRESKFDLKSLWYGDKIKSIQQVIKRGECPNCWTRCFSGYSMLSSPTGIIKISYNQFKRRTK